MGLSKKMCDTKKTMCVCINSLKLSGTVILSHDYDVPLESPGAHTFCVLAVLYNYVIFGADTTITLTQEPLLLAPLFVTIDKKYREWQNTKERPPIPHEYVLSAKYIVETSKDPMPLGQFF